MQKDLWFWVPKAENAQDVKWSQKRVRPKIELDPIPPAESGGSIDDQQQQQREMFDGWFYRQVGHGVIVPLTSSLPCYFDSASVT